jgi:hypothetical protein
LGFPLDRLQQALRSSEKVWGPFLIATVLTEQQAMIVANPEVYHHKTKGWLSTFTSRLVLVLLKQDLRARHARCEQGDEQQLDASKLVPAMWACLQEKVRRSFVWWPRLAGGGLLWFAHVGGFNCADMKPITASTMKSVTTPKDDLTHVC